MTETSFANSLHARIEAEYQRRGDTRGWRFLASPPNVLNGVRVVFIGLNPAGDKDRKDHPRFSTTKGSAYVDEVWKPGNLAGESKLQIQVRALFELIDEEPEQVLAGQLVPFRSPRWSDLDSPNDAVEFGRNVWREVLARARPHVVFAMGAKAASVAGGIVGAMDIEKYSVDWGSISARRGWFPRADGSKGAFIHLPHLSTFSIFKRPEDRGTAEIRRLLEGVDRIGQVR